jgi:hypothetical protein
MHCNHFLICCAVNALIKSDVGLYDCREYVENTIRDKDDIPEAVKEGQAILVSCLNPQDDPTFLE